MKRFLFLSCLTLLLGCKKIDYQAVQLIESSIEQLEQTDDVRSFLINLADNTILPEDVRTHLHSTLAKDSKRECFTSHNLNRVQHFLRDIRSYLLYRYSELSDYIICDVNVADLKMYKLTPEENFLLTVQGMNLDYESIQPGYISESGVYIDIPSLYCTESDTAFQIRLNGTNGLPIKSNMSTIALGRHQEWQIPVVHIPISPFGLTYQVHVRKQGWLSPVKESRWAGTKGGGTPMESILLRLEDSSNCQIRYRIKAIGQPPTDWRYSGEHAGETGQSLIIEAIWIELVDCPGYQIEYQGHIENIGDSEWVKNGAVLGAENSNLRIEAIKIQILEDFIN